MYLAGEGGRGNLEFEFRTASWRDLGDLRALEKCCFDRDRWPWFDLLAALVFPETVRHVSTLNDRIVGFVIGDRRRGVDMGWIATICVHPDFRRQGLGEQLLQTCEQALDVHRVRLTLRESNKDARRLYERMGYAEADRWVRYYRNKEDGIVMEKWLHPQ